MVPAGASGQVASVKCRFGRAPVDVTVVIARDRLSVQRACIWRHALVLRSNLFPSSDSRARERDPAGDSKEILMFKTIIQRGTIVLAAAAAGGALAVLPSVSLASSTSHACGNANAHTRNVRASNTSCRTAR